MTRYLHASRLALFVCTLLTATTAPAATISWTGPAGGSWATGSNWSNSTGPAATDTASFSAAGASSLPGDVTSVLNIDRTVAGLSYNNLVGKYHTTDFAGHTLTIAGNLNFNLDQGQTTTTTLRNGALVLNGGFANINVGRAASGSSTAVADLAGLTSLNATLQELQVGTSTAGGATGTLTLAPSNTITAQRLWVGTSFGSSDTKGTLHLGQNNTIVADEFHVAQDNSNGTVDVVTNATINLGTATRRTVFEIANQNTNTNNTYSGVVDFKNAAVNLRLDSLLVAQKLGGPGGVFGQFLAGGSGSVTVGDAAARGSFVVANTINGGGTQGTVDFGRLGAFQAYVNDFWVGRTVSGSATGNVTLAAANTIDSANGILVGVGGSGGTLTLGRTSNTLLTNQLVIGQNYSNGLVKVAAGGSLTLGSAAGRTTLIVGSGTTNTNETYTGKLDLTGGGPFNAFLGDLTVGLKDGGPGGETGTLIGGNGGSIDIGAAGNTANFYVARTLSGGQSTGIVDFSGMTTLTANLNTLAVGTMVSSGNAQGTLTLAAKNTINATTITVGAGAGSGSVALGTDNTILATQLTIGKD